MRQHCLAEKPYPASSAMTGYLAFGRTPPQTASRPAIPKASSVSSSLMRSLAAASSLRSLVEGSGLTPRSMRSCAFHRYTVASASPNSAAATRTGRPARTSFITRRRHSGS
jgi:hypothetical protein